MDTKKWRLEKSIKLFGLGVLALFIFNLTNLEITHALDDNVSVTLNTVLSLSLSDAAINIPVTPSDSGTFSSTSFTATASTNNSTGYKLLLTDKDTDTNLIHAVTSTVTIPTLSSNTTKANFPNNQWGLSLDDTNYLPTPASDGAAITVKEATTPVSDQASTIYTGTKVTNATMSGAYTAVVTVSIIANPTPTSFGTAYALAGMTKVQAEDDNYYYTMQDMNKSICDIVSNEQQATLVDTRNSKTYTIFKSKAPDSKCWMNQNLDLNLSSSTTLTNQNTDLNSVDSWTPESPNGDTITPGNLSSSNWGNDYDNPYSYDPGDVYYYTSNSTADDIEYGSLDACKAAPHTEAECKHYHTGNFYSWPAAIASNDASALTTQYTQAPDSICPRGWRLPQGPLSASDYSDFDDLLVAQGIKSTGSSTSYLANGFKNIRTSPLFLVRAGSIVSKYHNLGGEIGNYWSAGVESGWDSYGLSFTPGSMMIHDSWDFERYQGFSVRCLANNLYLYSLNYSSSGTNVSNLPSRQIARSANSTYSFTTSSDIPTRTGYSFLGYATSPDGEVVYQPGATVSVSSTSPTTTLYAKWGDNLGFHDSGITTMQAMTSSICSAASRGTTGLLQDTRDDKVYSVFKGNDDKCWMSQNLDLDLFTSVTLTNTDTDLNNVTTWTPESPNGNTIAPGNLSSSTWTNDHNNPYSYDPGNVYYYTSGTASDDTEYASLSACTTADHTAAECQHYHAGNYYNFSAAVASNDTSSPTPDYTQMPDSICPKGWRLPQGPESSSDYSDFNDLFATHGIINSGASGSGAFLSNGFNNIRTNPLFFVRAGGVNSGSQSGLRSGGLYWSSSIQSSTHSYYFYFDSGYISPQSLSLRYGGRSVRCLAH